MTAIYKFRLRTAHAFSLYLLLIQLRRPLPFSLGICKIRFHNDIFQRLLKRSGFTLMELMIVIVIIALAAVFSFKAWSAHLVKAEFDSAVNEFIAVFQEARSYAVKNAEVNGDENTSYTISFANDVITLSGVSGDISVEIFSDSWGDVIFDCGDWGVSYTTPYADFTVDSGADADGNLTCTITSARGDLSRDIIVRASSGIAEIMR